MKTVVTLLTMIALLVVVYDVKAQESTKSTVKLLSGEVMSGVAGIVKDGSLTLITEYGPVRIPLEKISPESKTKLGISEEGASSAALVARVLELDELVARLREENATLRRAAGSAPASQPAVSGVSLTTGATPSETGMSYRISSTGKRHNSRCRYYSSNGRAGTANEGVACKVCGG